MKKYGRHILQLSLRTQFGFTYVELMLVLLLTSLLMAGLIGVLSTATNTAKDVQARNDIATNARFAMQRMVVSISNSRLLLLPLNDNSSTNWPENIREQTIPASTPIGDSTLATAVLAVTLPANVDLDKDGFPDADDDRDGRIDEDLRADMTFDNVAGIYLIDDDGDGDVDEGDLSDDDESGIIDEDSLNGADDDGDGQVDEDIGEDMNNDGCPGICGIDDDNDGNVDEGNNDDDDEDGSNREDWYNPVVFYLENQELKQRMPVPWDTNVDSEINGKDFITSTIADNVTGFRVERLLSTGLRGQIVDIRLEITHPDTGERISLQTRIRVGSGL